MTAPVGKRPAEHDPLGGRPVASDVDAVLRRRAGGGSPLPADVASNLGAGFGTDLGHVRVHTDPEANRVSRDLQAVAFSYGSDLYFSSGAFAPHSASGRQLLAHELAHTLQPGDGGAQTEVGRADDPAEHAADVAAAAALRRAGG